MAIDTVNQTLADLGAVKGGIETNCLRNAERDAFSLSILSTLSRDQLDVLIPLFEWVSSAKPTESEMGVRFSAAFGGDRRFAESVVMALMATSNPRLIAAND